MGHTEEFTSFARDRTQALLRSAYLLTGDQQLAEDLVQASLARTYAAWRRLDDPANVEAYTRKVMYRLQISSWRRRKLREWVTADLPEPRREGTDPTDAADVRIVLRAALLKLPPRQRAVLVLRFFEDQTEAEAADLLDITVGTVKSQAAKGLARLRAIAPELADPYTEERSLR
jgi:RNA polymerase sigma-70 factor (sigma-E family)